MRRSLIAAVPLLAASLALVTGVTAAGRAVNVGNNIDLTKLSGDEAEATIQINPANPKQIFVAMNPVITRRSTDGGSSWTSGGSGIGSSCCDNAAAWDEFGNLFLTNINGGVDKIRLYLSVNGGKDFTKLLNIDTGAIDQPTVKAAAGMVWVTWNDDGTIKARGAQVTGLGSVGAFSAEQDATGSDTLGGQFGDIAISPDGAIVVTWQTDTGTIPGCPCAVYVNTDPDGLGPLPFAAAVQATTTNVEKFDAIPAQSERTIDAEANLAYDRSGGAFDGRLYLVYTDEDPDESDDTDIFIRRSDDNGATWGAPVLVNDDATTNSQLLPYLAVDRSTGKLIVTWYDARNDGSDNHDVQYFGAVSEDGGVTFGTNFKISDGTSDGDDVADSFFQFGDYSWVDYHDNTAFPVWSDNSNSTGTNPNGTHALDLYTAKILTAPFCLGAVATIEGTPASDVIVGTPGNDVIAAGDGDDDIDGEGGNDKICGEDGDDTIKGGIGKDTLDGGADDDTFDEEAASNGPDKFMGGNGEDVLSYAARSAAVTIKFDTTANEGQSGEGDYAVSGVESGIGGSANDKLIGNASANTFTGGAGADTLKGKDGADTLNAVDGVPVNDVVDGGNGTDACVADAGDTVTNCP
jgi:Ca2+-binding RTX toxin-like protein